MFASEVGVVAVHGDVGEAFSVGEAVVGDRVDPPEDAVSDGRPVGSVEGGVDPQFRSSLGGKSQVSGVDQHLGGNATPVHAGTTEGPGLDNGHVPVVVFGADQGVAGAGADD